MKREEIKVCILRVGGTNCDNETKRSFNDSGVLAKDIHLNRLVKNKDLYKYDILVIPGGFSFGDYVRAGAILAKSFSAKLGRELGLFVDEGKPVIGICNGFQMLVEAGLLPAFKGVSRVPEASLATNSPIGFHCRWIHLRHENRRKCIFTRNIPTGKTIRIPIAHGEGRFLFSAEKEESYLSRLIENDQLVFRYSDAIGNPAEGIFPLNPNGSYFDIAGICNSEGTVFGLMPHPERAYYGWQLPDWTKTEKIPDYADGRLIFESAVNYVIEKF